MCFWENKGFMTYYSLYLYDEDKNVITGSVAAPEDDPDYQACQTEIVPYGLKIIGLKVMQKSLFSDMNALSFILGPEEV